MALALADTSLSGDERRVVAGIVESLREELGDALDAIWLFGSRARGEPGHGESDVDLLVLLGHADWTDGQRLQRLVWRVAEDAGAEPYTFAVHVRDREWLRGRREIDDFFVGEVDRDKVVLCGAP